MRIACAVIFLRDSYPNSPGPDIYKNIECVNYDEDFIEVLMKDSDSSSTYPTFNVLKVEQYWEEV